MFPVFPDGGQKPLGPLAHPKPPKRKRDRRYMLWISSLPCCVTGTPGPNHAHHVRLGHHGGMARKPDDDRCVPLTWFEHGETERLGEKAYWESRGKDPEELIREYRATYAQFRNR